ncbi:LLM class flavin-dependent oxidoreductase [Janibacter sp. YIM B02568]|uniref:LLM class flavin-dependent oxidoreductase n=1 Tax=Janibacter endophyticus TaxID=2806261 RepID=UPI00194ED6B8|nr:LLM class flavin-dependent oxidoreductase [Janibacter endophyticus]MBM6544840.1 LLM class flavin-dependent oxidoreductase [Janibacter endophyticus]
MRLSLLDLAMVRSGQPIGEALADTVHLAQVADELGTFERLWFAEHHNMRSIGSSATAVLIAHVAARTERIRVGSGGVMLPNHAPLTVAEAFGTLAELHGDRIDLGLGRAPGTDQVTMRALRRNPADADRFPQDVLELQGYLSDQTRIEGIHAYPGEGTRVPIYILGSSLFGAQLAAQLGLPYAFASHFAPDHLQAAVRAYRDGFRPSEQLAEPYVIAALNVIAADTDEEADALRRQALSSRVRSLARRVPQLAHADLDDDIVAELMDTPVGQQARHMATYTVHGARERVAEGLADFQRLADADELMVANAASGRDARERTLHLLADIASA